MGDAVTNLSIPTTTTVRTIAAVPVLLRLEAALAASVAIGIYAWLGFSWWLFAALILTPDLFMLGYLAGPRIGAATYNFGHTYIVPAALGAAGFLLHEPMIMAVAAIWTAHIGLDRVMGYGLKLPGSFKATHLSPLR